LAKRLVVTEDLFERLERRVEHAPRVRGAARYEREAVQHLDALELCLGFVLCARPLLLRADERTHLLFEQLIPSPERLELVRHHIAPAAPSPF
jgi:hypothetical protein